MKTEIEWISFDYARPLNSRKVIVKNENDIQSFGIYDSIKESFYPEYESDWFEGEITHWAYLPEIQKEPKFKVGDRVNFYSTMNYKNPSKATLKYIEGNYAKIQADGSSKLLGISKHQLKKLKKKKVEFKIGDRVICKGLLVQRFKGTIKELGDFFARVKHDPGTCSLEYDCYYLSQIKKLKPKKIEFKFGDRVKLIFGIKKGNKGIFIKRCDPFSIDSIIKLDMDLENNNVSALPTSYLKKLKKKVK